MRTIVLYIAVTNGPKTARFCERFASTWREFPPGLPYELIVLCNGGPLKKSEADLFDGLFCSFWPRVNDAGFDISAYQDIARKTDAFLVCLGESVYFHRQGWLARLVDAREKHGPGMYGCFSSYLVRPHLQTSAFGCDAKFLRAHPKPHSRRERYEFEHGPRSLCRMLSGVKLPTKLVTWDGEYDEPDWRKPGNILWRGDQSNCLMFCNHTDDYVAALPSTKLVWENHADTLVPKTREFDTALEMFRNHP